MSDKPSATNIKLKLAHIVFAYMPRQNIKLKPTHIIVIDNMIIIPAIVILVAQDLVDGVHATWLGNRIWRRRKSCTRSQCGWSTGHLEMRSNANGCPFRYIIQKLPMKPWSIFVFQVTI